MLLESLRLRNYGKHRYLEVRFAAKNILYGSDQTGKTSILKAIYSFLGQQPQTNTTNYSYQDIIIDEQTYATVEGVFKTTSNTLKIKNLIKKDSVTFFREEQQVDIDKLSFLPIVFFSSEVDLTTNNTERKRFFNVVTKQAFPFLIPVFNRLHQEITSWKQQVLEKQFEQNAYYLDLLQKTETAIATHVYEITQKQLELIKILNLNIVRLTKTIFCVDQPFFMLKFKNEFIQTDNKANFVPKLKEVLLEARTQTKHTTVISRLLFNDFVFVSEKSLYRPSHKERALWTFWAQTALAEFLKVNLKKAVLFLVDDFQLFDLSTQKKLWKVASSFAQYIISVNQPVWKRWPFAEEIMIHQIG